MQLAIITDFEYRVQVVYQIVMERGWQLLACVGQAQPSQWLTQQAGVDLVIVDLDLPDAIASEYPTHNATNGDRLSALCRCLPRPSCPKPAAT